MLLLIIAISMLVPIAIFINYTLAYFFIGKFLFLKNTPFILPENIRFKYEEITIAKKDGNLNAVIVNCPDSPVAVFICHGGNDENISVWINVLNFLFDKNISAMIFDYSTVGKSTGKATISNFIEDVIIAYEYFDGYFEKKINRFIVCYSLGCSLFIQAFRNLKNTSDIKGLVLTSSFCSLRDYLFDRKPIPSFLKYLIPDVLNSLKKIKQINLPILIIHSKDDKSVPYSHANKLFDIANEPKSIVLHNDCKHEEIYCNPNDAYWEPILKFFKRAY